MVKNIIFRPFVLSSYVSVFSYRRIFENLLICGADFYRHPMKLEPVGNL